MVFGNELFDVPQGLQATEFSIRPIRTTDEVELDYATVIESKESLRPCSAFLSDEGGGRPANRLIYANTAHHFREHLGWIDSLAGDG